MNSNSEQDEDRRRFESKAAVWLLALMTECGRKKVLLLPFDRADYSRKGFHAHRSGVNQTFSSPILGRTVHEEIVRVRMERVATLLLTTGWTLPQIAEHLDFSHAEYMGVAFKKHTGKSPGEYRRANRLNAANI